MFNSEITVFISAVSAALISAMALLFILSAIESTEYEKTTGRATKLGIVTYYIQCGDEWYRRREWAIVFAERGCGE